MIYRNRTGSTGTEKDLSAGREEDPQFQSRIHRNRKGFIRRKRVGSTESEQPQEIEGSTETEQDLYILYYTILLYILEICEKERLNQEIARQDP
jgi:hypothetical protein